MKIILTEEQVSRIFMNEGLRDINKKANEAEKNPTEAQKKAGNYKMGHLKYAGFDITIENPKGSYRTFKNPDGSEGKTHMNNHYGYFTKTVGYDGDQVDVFLGPNEDAENVYVVDQNNSKREFDESKVMLGFNSSQEAKKAYLSNFDKDWKGFRKITGVPVDVFRKWLYSGRKQRKPFSEYVFIKDNITEMKSKIKCLLDEIDAKNSQLNIARKLRNDEFYTRRPDIELELGNYEKELNGKIVYCNCDNYTKSNFYGYFKENFNRLGLRGLVATGYNENGHGVFATFNGKYEENGLLRGDGSFSSQESIELLNNCDIVVSNPPFSLFREYINILVNSGKKFLVLGSMQAIKYKDIFKLFKEHKLWTGYTGFNKGMYFNVPDDFEYSDNYKFKREIDGQKVGRVSGISWFTNIGTPGKEIRNEILTKTYNEAEYPKYENLDAIEAGKLSNVPYDYPGNIGVSFTVMDKKSEDGLIHCEDSSGNEIKYKAVGLLNKPKLNGKIIYARAILKRVQ